MARIRTALACVALVLSAAAALAQDFTGLARPEMAGSAWVEDGDALDLTLALSQPVPWRAITLDRPRRLVLDFRTVDWTGADLGSLGVVGEPVIAMPETGDGWSRLVVPLGEPYILTEAGMGIEADGGARLTLRLERTDDAGFAAAAGPFPEAAPLDDPAAMVPPQVEPESFVVAIDPGHGGIDPGAERDGLSEADLMLALGLELAEAAARAGMVPVLTRDADAFVPLATRMTIARNAGADVLLSLHADALEQDEAFGASVYTLSEAAADDASERMVERHERGDLLAGLDLADTDDRVATALLDFARQDTSPASQRLAEAVVAGLAAHGARVNSRPHREARLAVLNAADFPSVLVEVGFLSDAGDRERLSSQQGRAPIVAGLLSALGAWSADEATRGGLRMR